LVSILLALGVLYARYFAGEGSFLTSDATQFYAMFAAYVILVLGCIMRGL
jgi:hypothetical protein